MPGVLVCLLEIRKNAPLLSPVGRDYQVFSAVGYKTIRLANVLGTWTRGLVTNRVGKSADLSWDEIEHFMGRTLGSMPILVEIPEDEKVQEAERESIPVVVYEPECDASVAIDELAKLVVGEVELPYKPYEESAIKETTDRLIRALTGRRA